MTDRTTKVSPHADTQIAPDARVVASKPVHDYEAATLDAPTSAPSGQSPGPDLLSTIPDAQRYAVAGEIARGGLGRILKARDLRLRRNVALKELLSPGGGAESRFLREAHITARLQHPSIIPLYDAGRGASGEAFYSMKLVTGQSLEEAIATKKTLTDRLSLLPHVIHVADAIAYAHSKRVIHRDLKPQNVLVGEFGETVVIDWGIAKDLAQSGADSGSIAAAATAWAGTGDLTIDGTIMGTPAYMPPEQARGEPVDERADVYALGAILYHLMAGVPPYDEDLRDILKKLLSRPPVPPLPLSERVRGVPNDLQAIVTKAMAPTVHDRYPSAKELAADLQKFQTGQIVGAYHYTPFELVARWLRKNALVASLIGLMAVGGAASVVQIVEKSRLAEEGRRAAETARSKAEAAEERERTRADEVTLEQARLSLDHDPQRSLDFVAALSPSFPRMSAARVIAEDALSRTLPVTLRGHKAGVFGAWFSPDGKRVVSASYDKTLRLWDLATLESRVLEGHTAEVSLATFSPDGKQIASISYDRTARLWDIEKGTSVVLEGHKDWLSGVAFSPAGDRLITSSGDSTLRIWDLRAAPITSRVLSTPDELLLAMERSADGARLVTTGSSGTVRLWDMETGQSKVVATGSTETSSAAILTPDGAFVITRETARGVLAHEIKTGKTTLLVSDDDNPKAMRASPDGSRVAVSIGDNSLRIIDVAKATTLRVLHGHTGEVRSFAFSPDGARLASGADDQTVRLWDLATSECSVFRAHGGQVTRVSFSPDGRRIVSSSLDGTARVWTPEDKRGVLGPYVGTTTDVAFLDETRVAFAEYANEIQVCSVDSRACDKLEGHTAQVNHIAISPDRSLLASAGADGTLRLWDVTKTPPSPLRTIVVGSDVRDVAFLPDGKSLVSAGMDKAFWRWDVATGEGKKVGTHPDICHRVVASKKGALVAASCQDSTIHLFHLDTGKETILRGHESRILDLAFSPDGALLATASLDRTARVWNIATGEPRVLPGNDGGLYTIAFSPDGALLATGSDSGVVRVWSLAKGESRAFQGHQNSVRYVIFSADGRTLASTSRDGTARLWDVPTGESRALRGHTDGLRKIAFSPSGARLCTTSEDGTARLFKDDLPHEEPALRQRLTALASLTAPRE